MATGTRERIMDEALKLFAVRGFAGTPVTAIEAAAGLAAGSGSFYRHFRSKADVLESAVERELVRLRQLRPARLPRAATDPETLADQLRSDLDYLTEVRTLIALLVREHATAPQVVRRVHEVLVADGLAGTAGDLPAATGPARDGPAVTGSAGDLPAATGGGAPDHGGPAERDHEATATVVMCATIGYFLTTEFFGAPPGDVDPDRFTRTLAGLLTAD